MTSTTGLEPQLVVALGLLHPHDLLQGANRDLDLVERGLARRQPLQPEAGCEQGHQDAVALVLAGVADQLVGEPGDHRQQEDPAHDQPVPDWPPDEREDEDADHHDP